MRDRMILTTFFFNPQGDHRMSWRHPAAPTQEVFGLDHFRRFAQAAEAARLDALFVADHVAMWDLFESAVAHYANARLEPITLLSALAAVTDRIGLIATASASYSEPYNIARIFASLDHLSGGRAGWNVVTSGMVEEAMNFGRDANIEHRLRYTRAAEYLDVVTALWDSIEDDALLFDKEGGQYADPAKIHRIDHKGAHFQVRGPANVPRPPQGRPLIAQAGSSPDGKDLAARYADLNFALKRTVEEGLAYRRDFDERLARFGRRRQDLKVLLGVQPVVAASRAEAEEKRDYLESLVPDRIGVDLVSSWTGVDMSRHPIDGPLPPLPEPESFDGQQTNLERIRLFAREGLTIRQAARRISGGGSAASMSGTATDIADEMEAWVSAGAADGFALMFPVLPEDMTNFLREVIPELQRRGLAQTDYAPGTLRDRLCLPRPANRFAAG